MSPLVTKHILFPILSKSKVRLNSFGIVAVIHGELSEDSTFSKSWLFSCAAKRGKNIPEPIGVFYHKEDLARSIEHIAFKGSEKTFVTSLSDVGLN